MNLARPSPFRLVPAAAILALAGCGGSATSESSASDDAVAGVAHNAADVEFATAMIPHHAEALVMADLTVGRPLDEDVAALVDDIRAAQTPEIELMADWLEEWGEPVPETMRDHEHGGHSGEMGETGEMRQADLERLAEAPTAEFQALWLQMMVEHHEGAVSMAEDELEDGTFGPALDLAEDIVASQSDEIDRMEQLLGR